MKPFLFLILFCSFGYSQISNREVEKYPLFDTCQPISSKQQESCFRNTLQQMLYKEFRMPEALVSENYSGEVVVLFEVKKNGDFNVFFIDAYSNSLKDEIARVFATLPQVDPATYNGRPTSMQFRLPIRVPIGDNNGGTEPVAGEIEVLKKLESQEYDNIERLPYSNDLYESSMNIPLSHERYSRFSDEMNTVGTNSHTSIKPFLYQDVKTYYDFDEELEEMKRETTSWFGRKLWNEHLVEYKGKDFWFVADLGVDLQLGKDLKSDYSFTYNNTRAAMFQGGLGKGLNFYASVFESQGRFADYFNEFAKSLRPDGGNPAIIPGRGIAKEFMSGGFDYPVAEGYLSYTPNKFFNLQFGHGRNFIGDGYRSLFLSDNASPYPYFKLNTTFWKFKYSNIWMSLRDVRPEVTADGSFRTKFMATHYLSYNVTKRFNLGLFESVIWENDNDRGFDLNYLNPVIFYRAIEFSTGSRGGNALLGLSGKYKLGSNKVLYSQLMIDEFSSLDIFSAEGSYKNKIGVQLGAKYFNAFNIENLLLQAEYNQVRPFAYSHNSVVLNYGHNNQSLAHLWGANFKEIIGIARYRYNRWYGNAKVVIGERGFDFDEEPTNFGGNIYISEDDRDQDNNHSIGQGNTATSFFGEFEAGYIVNPSTNLKAFASLIYRNFDPVEEMTNEISRPTVWFNFGIRTDIFNWYFDY